MDVATAEKIRACAMALPEVTEKQHHLFDVPLWRVREKVFVGIGRGGSTVVFRISEESADAAEAADPEHATAVRRSDRRRSFLGLEVDLASLPGERAAAFVREAWETQAPKRLVREHSVG